ncbi:TraG/TraD/VirD4 family protein [Corynebacterium bovis]|uniref:TraG/TraD/VirD4 family protein n=1 Tax=Corynebacterium bovis TaxID=36808 RepID=UPI0021AB7A88|nr:TraG/TraD/VirD4 family protein [Corynebacterium bovis]
MRWHALPDVYSHFGSKGIVISSVFQSFRQAKRIWGDDVSAALRSRAAAIVGRRPRAARASARPASDVAEHRVRSDSTRRRRTGVRDGSIRLSRASGGPSPPVRLVSDGGRMTSMGTTISGPPGMT